MKATETVALPWVGTSEVGADGVVRCVTETDEDAVPLPAALTARNNTEYVVPLVRPLMVTGDVVPASASAHEEPALIEY